MALPRGSGQRFNWPRIFNASAALSPPRDGYDVSLAHFIFNKPAIAEIMKKDAFYFTILREPVTHYESTFNYFIRLPSRLKLPTTNQTYLEYFVEDFERAKKILAHTNKIEAVNLARNGMMFDLGLPMKDFDNEDKIKDHIKRLDEELDFVMIAEYLEESLVLLRRKLCWDLEDIVFLPMNARPEAIKTKITETLARNIRRWNNADVALYSHFKTALMRTLDVQDEAFFKEVDALKKRNAELRAVCVESELVNDKIVHFSHVLQYQLNSSAVYNSLCRALVRTSNEYMIMIWNKQLRKLLQGSQTVHRDQV